MEKNDRVKMVIVVMLLLGVGNSVFSQEMDKMWGESSVKTDALKSERVKLFSDGNYGMFIHWGLFSNLGGQWKGKTYYGIGEWIMNPRMAGIPVDEYMPTAKDFNPK